MYRGYIRVTVYVMSNQSARCAAFLVLHFMLTVDNLKSVTTEAVCTMQLLFAISVCREYYTSEYSAPGTQIISQCKQSGSSGRVTMTTESSIHTCV